MLISRPIINILLIIFGSAVHFAVVLAQQSSCTVLPMCRLFNVTSSRTYTPDTYSNGAISQTGSTPPGSASLDNKPITFPLPEYLNITIGNSGNQIATLSLTMSPQQPQSSVVTVTCRYKGIGVFDPFLEEEKIAANAYKFQSCDDVIPQTGATTTGLAPLKPLDLVNVVGVQARVVSGGNTAAGEVTGIFFEVEEAEGTGGGCLKSEDDPVEMVLVGGGGGGGGKVYSAVWKSPVVTTFCQDAVEQVATSTFAENINDNIGVMTTFIPTPVSSDSSSSSSSISNGDIVPPVSSFSSQKSSDSSSSSSSSISSSGNNNNGGGSGLNDTENSNLSTVLAGVLGGGLVVVLLSAVIIFFCMKTRRHRHYHKDLEKNNVGNSFNSIDYSNETLDYTNTDGDNGDEDDDFFEEQEQFSKPAHNASSSNLTGNGCLQPRPFFNRKQGDIQEQTLLNTKAVIALPGFIKMDYNADLRPDTVLAEGGGGVIYLADLLDERMKEKHRVKRVAVKLVKNPANWSHDQFLTNFRQEVSIMWSLNFHENIIKLIGYTEEPMSIIMKHYSQSLGDLIKNPEFHHLLTVETTLRFSYHVVHAMTEMHSLGIVHRDLKTINLLIDAPAGSANDPWMWKVVVCDFGLAKPLLNADNELAAKIADVQGISVKYAAPEVFKRVYAGLGSKTKLASASSGDLMTVRRSDGLDGGMMRSTGDLAVSPIVVPDNYSGEDEKKADVYAYAIIQWELVERKSVWLELNNDEIEWHVRNGDRPLVSEETNQLGQTEPVIALLLDLMHQSWIQDTFDRPSFMEIKSQLDPHYSLIPQPFGSTSQRMSSVRMSQQDLTGVGHMRKGTAGSNVNTRMSFNQTRTMPRSVMAASQSNLRHSRMNTYGRTELKRSRYPTSTSALDLKTGNIFNSQQQSPNNH